MKYVLTVLMFAGLMLSLNVLNINAAINKRSKTNRETMEAQPREMTLTGVVTMSNDGKSYIIKASAGFAGKLWFLPESKFRYNEFEMLEVKAVCMVRGSTVVSVRSIDVVNKAAYEANLARIKAEAIKKAEEKKAVQQKRPN